MNNFNQTEMYDFWNSRADLGLLAGTNDIILKKMEMQEIAKHVREGMKILDVGCGNGITAAYLAENFKVNIIGVDFSDKMIDNANKIIQGKKMKGNIIFQKDNIQDLLALDCNFDLIYTERTLINLPTWDAQKMAIHNIFSHLVKKGIYAMCESSMDGLNKINSLRASIDLPQITHPWHNRYLFDEEINELAMEGITLDSVNDFSSTYYFLSRVVNAHIALNEGKEPDYNSIINQLALKLPPFGDVGQTKIWLWRKNE
jgi:ubiquinone/menaquinone biosynthesis C-methylase UbiE